MSHIHLPDGSIPFVWWAGGFVLCIIIIALLVHGMTPEDARKKIPLTGIAVALMLIAMYVPLGILPLHLSLAVLTGILIGPEMGFIAVFVVNIILALTGHGGITLIGINTLILGSELVVGFYVYKLLSKIIKTVPASVFSVLIAVSLSISLTVGITSMTVGAVKVIDFEHSHEDNEIHTSQEDVNGENVRNNGEAAGDENSHRIDDIRWFLFGGWGAILIILALGIIIESLVTAGIVSFIGKVRPDLIDLNINH